MKKTYRVPCSWEVDGITMVASQKVAACHCQMKAVTSLTLSELIRRWLNMKKKNNLNHD